jgi:endo-1,4-beta-xylanase
MDSPEQTARRRALLDLLDRLRRQSAPIDGVGLQSHLGKNGGRFDARLYRDFLKQIADRGLRIVLTELDVLEHPSDQGADDDGIEAQDASVAATYAAFLAAALDERAVKAVVTWGLSDRYTWLTSRYDPRFARADGRPNRPLPFDAAFQPKPAFHAIAAALRAAPRRSPA